MFGITESPPTWVPVVVLGMVGAVVLIVVGALLWREWCKRQRRASGQPAQSDVADVPQDEQMPDISWVISECSVDIVRNGTWMYYGNDVTAASIPLADVSLLDGKDRALSAVVGPDCPSDAAVFVWWAYAYNDRLQHFFLDALVVAGKAEAQSLRSMLEMDGHMLECELELNEDGVLMPSMPLEGAIRELQAARLER